MRADIHDGQEHKRSIHGPDTEAQDQSSPSVTFGLQHTAGPYNSTEAAGSAARPTSASPRKLTSNPDEKSVAERHGRRKLARCTFHEVIANPTLSGDRLR